MAAVVVISETNGTAPGTTTDDIAHSDYGSVDQVELDPEANPLAISTSSFQKWQRWKLEDLMGSVRIENLKYWVSGAAASGGTHKFNGNTVQGTYDTTKKTTYETPVATDAESPNTVPTSEPSSANIGCGGSLAGNLDANDEYSDFVVSVISLDGTAVAGNTRTVHFTYDEVA